MTIALSLPATREELVVSLAAAGFTVADGMPAQIGGPLAILTHDNPYLLPGDTFDPAELLCQLRLLVVFPVTTDKAFSSVTDRKIQDAYLAIPARWSVTDISWPFRLPKTDAIAASQFRIATQITITEE